MEPRSPLLEMLKKDVARRTGAAVGDVQVLVAESTTWRDSSLGCPQLGRVYMQILTPGYRILLGAAGEEFEYHTDPRSRWVRCTGQSAE